MHNHKHPSSTVNEGGGVGKRLWLSLSTKKKLKVNYFKGKSSKIQVDESTITGREFKRNMQVQTWQNHLPLTEKQLSLSGESTKYQEYSSQEYIILLEPIKAEHCYNLPKSISINTIFFFRDLSNFPT